VTKTWAAMATLKLLATELLDAAHGDRLGRGGVARAACDGRAASDRVTTQRPAGGRCQGVDVPCIGHPVAPVPARRARRRSPVC